MVNYAPRRSNNFPDMTHSTFSVTNSDIIAAAAQTGMSKLRRKYYFKNFRFGIFHLLTIWKIFRSAGYMVPFRYPVVLYRPRDRPSLGPRWVRGPAYPGHPSGRWDDPPEPTAPRSYVTRATPVSRVLHAPQPTVYRVWNGHSTFNAPSCC